MGQKRIWAVAYDIIWLVIVAVLILPIRTPYIRNVVNSASPRSLRCTRAR